MRAQPLIVAPIDGPEYRNGAFTDVNLACDKFLRRHGLIGKSPNQWGRFQGLTEKPARRNSR